MLFVRRSAPPPTGVSSGSRREGPDHGFELVRSGDSRTVALHPTPPIGLTMIGRPTSANERSVRRPSVAKDAGGARWGGPPAVSASFIRRLVAEAFRGGRPRGLPRRTAPGAGRAGPEDVRGCPKCGRRSTESVGVAPRTASGERRRRSSGFFDAGHVVEEAWRPVTPGRRVHDPEETKTSAVARTARTNRRVVSAGKGATNTTFRMIGSVYPTRWVAVKSAFGAPARRPNSRRFLKVRRIDVLFLSPDLSHLRCRQYVRGLSEVGARVCTASAMTRRNTPLPPDVAPPSVRPTFRSPRLLGRGRGPRRERPAGFAAGTSTESSTNWEPLNHSRGADARPLGCARHDHRRRPRLS